MSRYGFNVDNVEIVVGWDNPTQTFFGQTEVDGKEVIDTMIGMGRFDIRDIRSLEADLGYKIPADIQGKLLTDRGAALPPTPLQKQIAEVFEPLEDN